MPLPVIAATCEVHGDGVFTGGRDVTRVAGCHGGGAGGSGACGGTGHPASATGLDVVVVVVERVVGCVELLEAVRVGEADVGPIATTLATAIVPSTTEATTNHRFLPPDPSTLHFRDLLGQVLGSPAMAIAPKVMGS